MTEKTYYNTKNFGAKLRRPAGALALATGLFITGPQVNNIMNAYEKAALRANDAPSVKSLDIEIANLRRMGEGNRKVRWIDGIDSKIDAVVNKRDEEKENIINNDIPPLSLKDSIEIMSGIYLISFGTLAVIMPKKKENQVQ